MRSNLLNMFYETLCISVCLPQGLLKETERRKLDLSNLMENSAGLQTLVEGGGAQLEDKLCVLNETWDHVRTLTEDWLSAVLVSTFYSKVVRVLILMGTLKLLIVDVYRATRMKWKYLMRTWLTSAPGSIRPRST